MFPRLVGIGEIWLDVEDKEYMDKTVVAIAGLSVLVLGGIIAFSAIGSRNFEPRKQCMEHSVSLSMHIHPELEIYIDNQKQTIPANLGIDPTCMRALHTHDETGKLHVEYPQQHEFKLGDFFANWGQTFSKEQLVDKKVDEKHVITMMVDGQPSEEYENLILRDGQKIVIRYEAKK